MKRYCHVYLLTVFTAAYMAGCVVSSWNEQADSRSLSLSEILVANESTLPPLEYSPLEAPVDTADSEIQIIAERDGFDPTLFRKLVAESTEAACGDEAMKLVPVQVVEQANLLSFLLREHLSDAGLQNLGSIEQVQAIEAGLNAKMQSSRLTQAEIRREMNKRVQGIFAYADQSYKQLESETFDGLFTVLLDDVLAERSPTSTVFQASGMQCPIKESPKKKQPARIAADW
ncbi:MAG: hypothetical protein AAF722_13265 [Cyanobacteria bacterium P01_C01_bin.70]